MSDDMSDLVSREERRQLILEMDTWIPGRYKRIIERLLLTLDHKDAEIKLMSQELESNSQEFEQEIFRIGNTVFGWGCTCGQSDCGWMYKSLAQNGADNHHFHSHSNGWKL